MANYFLKCEHCGHLNEIKTSYLVFCESCSKKMENSFSNWRMYNAGKTFEDFQKEVCITDEQIKSTESTKPKNRKSISAKTSIGLIIGVSLIIIIGFGTAFVVQEYFFPDLEKYMNTDWTIQTCGTLGLQLEAPIKLEERAELDAQLPENAQEYVVKMETFESSVMNRKLYIMANTVQYVPKITASLEGAVKRSIAEMQKRPEVSDFKHDITPIGNSGIQGLLVSGKYKEGDQLYGYRIVTFVKGNVMWQVIIGYDYKDKFGYEISERLIKSISITPNIAGLLNNNRLYVMNASKSFK